MPSSCAGRPPVPGGAVELTWEHGPTVRRIRSWPIVRKLVVLRIGLYPVVELSRRGRWNEMRQNLQNGVRLASGGAKLF